MKNFQERFIKFAEDAGAAEGGAVLEVFKFRDPAKGQEIDLPKVVNGVNLQELIGHVIGKSRKETEGKYKDLIDSIKNEKSTEYQTLQEKIQQLEDEKLSAEERARVVFEREKGKYGEEINKWKSTAEKNWGMYKEDKIRNDIYAAFGGFDLYNPSQTLMVLRSMGNADLIEENGKHVTKLTFNIDGVDEVLTPKEAVAKFLALEENAHHLKNNLRPGNGTTSVAGGRKNADGTIAFTREQLRTDPKAMEEYRKKLASREPVTIID